jgi:hypothetical protein
MEPISTLILSFAFLMPVPVTQRLILDETKKNQYGNSKYLKNTILPLMADVQPAITDKTLYQPEMMQLVNARELLKRETKAYSLFESGWEEDGNIPPSKIAMTQALTFIDSLPSRLPLPRPMLSANGELGLYWDLDGGYAELSFETNGQISFFSRTLNGQEKFLDTVSLLLLDNKWLWDSVGKFDAPLLVAA